MENTQVKTYPTEAAANRRVAELKRLGMWPATVPLPDGRWRLTFDPDTAGQKYRAATEELSG